MELVERTTLYFREGNSDKVYEIDLCRVSNDSYLVNFRYGRRGANLKEGTKTAQPVTLTQARTFFDGLVREKTRKGYQTAGPGGAGAPAAPPPTTVQVSSGDPRHQAVMNRLAQGNNHDPKWSLDRVIWRAGELAIPEAAPLLVNLIGTSNDLRNYSIAWALGWCGDSSTIASLQRLHDNPATPEFVKRIAWEAIFKLSSPAGREALKAQKLSELPSRLQELINDNDTAGLAQALPDYLANQGAVSPTTKAIEQRLAEVEYWNWPRNRNLQNEIKAAIQEQIPELRSVVQRNYNDYYKGFFEIQTALREYISSEEAKPYVILDTLYQADHPCSRAILLELVQTAPFSRPHFQRLRHIFKMAEYRQDAEFFAIFAYRFDCEKSISRYYPPDRAYQKNTREYLQRRVWRTLKTLAEDSPSGQLTYITLATAILLQYSDADAEPPIMSNIHRYWDYQTRRYVEQERGGGWDAYARYLILNHLLYEHSPRYVPGHRAWACKIGYKPGDPAPAAREEAFPELWQQHPQALLQLLEQSQCHPIHQFAVKALGDCPDFCQQLPLATLMRLLGSAYTETLDFAFHLVRQRYNPHQPDLELVAALAHCQLAAAREQAYAWIDAQREWFITAEGFLMQLLTSRQTDTRQFAKRILGSTLLSEANTRLLIAQVIAFLLGLADEDEPPLAEDVGNILLESFMPQLRSLSMNVVLDLISHPLVSVKEVGARILLNHATPAADLPPNLIESLIASPHAAIQALGLRIFGQLPDERLLNDRVLIMAMAVNASPDLRSAIRPVIHRLAHAYPQVAQELAREFLNLLMVPEPHAGVHTDMIAILQADIPGWMQTMSLDRTLELLRLKSTAIQELGGVILAANEERFLPDFATAEIVKLGSHEVLAVRTAAWRLFRQRLAQIYRQPTEMLAAVRLLEAKWEDSKAFAFDALQELPDTTWTPELLVFICDSVQADVRQFGRDLVIQNFQTSYGQEYLLKFSEHPTADMQSFATNYLTTYAADNCQRLQELQPYFVTVLARVNKGRIAKQRIFAFLDAEAQKSAEAAAIVADILTRQSVTMAIGDKASAIEIMVRMKAKYPDLELPIQLKPCPSVALS